MSKASEYLEESEWNLKNTLKRIVGYTIAITFITLLFWIIYTESQGAGYCILATIISCIYVYYDIRIIIKKKDFQKNSSGKDH